MYDQERGQAPEGHAPGKQALVGSDSATPGAPGKRSRTQGLQPIPANGAGGGVALPDDVRARMEAAFGVDFSAVRVHEDGAAGGMAAEAYAHGTDLHFAPGRYNPTTSDGLALIGHELTHVVQQAQGRTPDAAQHKGGAPHESAALEREADAFGATAAAGGSVGSLAGFGGATLAVQRKVAVVAAARKPKLEVLGDGTPAHRGLTIAALETYVNQQADWFADPSFTAADREATWKVVNLLHFGGHVAPALAKLHTGEIAALASRTVLKKYVDGFNSSEETVQLKTPAPTLARALQLGQAILDLEAFVPTAVLRHVIPEYGLVHLVDMGKLAELKKYYTMFRPTLEKPAEWDHVQQLLDEGIATYAALVGWVSELHIFTMVTRVLLVGAVADKTRSRPVLLVLMSALDWNTAFLQADNLERMMLNATNQSLIVQGRTIGAVTAQVSRVARDYGQRGKLAQVVLAGHGSENTMEMASDSTTGTWDQGGDRVYYDGESDLDIRTKKDKDPKKSSDPKTNGTEALIDTILTSMDPATANIVFAGCLINSHNVDPKLPLSGAPAAVQKQLQANIAAHPNLAEYVRARMVATGHNATLGASNSSTVFSTFNVDLAGHAQLSSTEDPDVAGTKLAYVRTGIEPEGVLRAAIECCADPAIGIDKTTTELRTRARALAGTADWQQVVTRVGLELALPAAGPVNVPTLLEVVQRIGTWGDYSTDVNAQRLADTVKPGEAKRLFTALAAVADAERGIAVHHAWTQFDARHATTMMTALNGVLLTSEQLAKFLSRKIIAPHLATLLRVGAPTQGQMLLALTIADQDGNAMPAPVRTFLRAAAGGAVTTTFPAALDVDFVLPNGGPRILEAIGLSPRAPAVATPVAGNVDADHDGKNELRVDTDPHRETVDVAALVVRDTPTSSGKPLGTLAKGTIVRVAGTARAGTWSMIDFNGAVGFVATKHFKK